jgi:hypothetical protein
MYMPPILRREVSIHLGRVKNPELTSASDRLWVITLAVQQSQRRGERKGYRKERSEGAKALHLDTVLLDWTALMVGLILN